MSGGTGTRLAGLVGVALGACLLALAPLLPTVVAGQLDRIAMPVGTVSWELLGGDASYLDTRTWEERTGEPVAVRTDIWAHPEVSDADRAVWSMRTTVLGEDAVLDHVERRAAFDRRTGLAVDCCGAHVAGDFGAPQEGLVFAFPPGEPPGDRPFYDPTLRAAAQMAYDGAETLHGLAVHRYTQHIEPTPVPGPERRVPAELVGLPGPDPVPVQRHLELTRTYWVEPVTGRVVAIAEDRAETLHPEDGGTPADLLRAELLTPESAVAANAASIRDQALWRRAVDGWLPIAFGAVGLVLVVGGALLVRRASRRTAATGAEGVGGPAAEQTELDRERPAGAVG
ncbi:DUF3068 domain-containing protein [Allonocardiopsis opalescens]|uniref:DUF3068 family protein n=1 Tax=Allonocardiopsis opalescens TaxID=1144618 RepID=A0A2T0QCE6_9ACTN|nr:DUF3068 domain-containing protein [Allonocardiopsis opalescens]PRY01582.1 Protein of unknown function (DUF3068) [Allonocardiopsis opalescens]